MPETIRFEVGGGLSSWSYDGRTFDTGEHQVDATAKLAQAVKDAAAAGVGVKLLRPKKQET